MDSMNLFESKQTDIQEPVENIQTKWKSSWLTLIETQKGRDIQSDNDYEEKNTIYADFSLVPSWYLDTFMKR